MLNHVLRAIASQPWAISPQGMDMMLGVLDYRLKNGGPLTQQQVEARLNGRQERKVRESPGNIAVISVRGVISNRINMLDDISQVGTSAERLDHQIRSAMATDSVKAVVLDMDSPGGAAAGTPEVAATLRELRGGQKPIIAQVNALAASACYWLAAACDEIVAVPSAQIGSVGVITVHQQIAKMLEMEGREVTVITSSPYKGEANPWEPLSEEAQAYLQQQVDEYDALFVNGVAEGRGIDAGRVRDTYGQGRTMIAENARKVGMIDRIGTLRDTLTRLGATYVDGDSDRNRAESPQRSPGALRRRLELEALK